jgi:hypothetical protein
VVVLLIVGVYATIKKQRNIWNGWRVNFIKKIELKNGLKKYFIIVLIQNGNY